MTSAATTVRHDDDHAQADHAQPGHAQAPAPDAADVGAAVLDTCRLAREASRQLAGASTAAKSAALHAAADALGTSSGRIIEANTADLEAARAAGTPPAMLDRLRLDAVRLASLSTAVREVAALPDPVGQVVRGSILPNGLRMRQVRVPMGVVAMVYEARPNVTVEASALILGSGNAAVLRGGSAARRTNRVLVDVLQEALAQAGLPRDAVKSVDEFGRGGVRHLMRARGLVDVLVPRGGAGLIRDVVEHSTVPVIETGVGNCHVYVDRAADLAQALEITLNAKTSRPSVCNAAETLLVHADVAADFLPGALGALAAEGVVLHGDERTARLAPDGVAVVPATDEDWAREYLGMEMAVAVVDDVDAALAHIRRWSSGHTEAVLTTDLRVADRFAVEVDSAAVIVNASTRFTDGGQMGLGAEIGISTQKLHARGPMGLPELTTTRWVVTGDGHVRR